MSNEGFLPGLVIGGLITYIIMVTVVQSFKDISHNNMLVRHNLMTVTNDASGNRVYFYTTNWIPEKP